MWCCIAERLEAKRQRLNSSVPVSGEGVTSTYGQQQQTVSGPVDTYAGLRVV
jgi:hypothetical protein